MIVRIAKILVIAVVVTLLAAVRPAWCEGWSLLHPFGSNSDPDTTTKKFTRKTQPEPTLWQKTSSGTKNLFNKTGETLGLKKPESKKPTMAYAKPPVIYAKKKEEQSWFGKMFQPEEKKPKTVNEWMSSTKQIVPAGESEATDKK